MADPETGISQRLMNWARAKSPWVTVYNSGGCNACDIEIIACLMPRFDVERFGILAKGSPRHADILIVTGHVTLKQASRLRRVWEQMLEPKYVIAMGACAVSGGPFADGYNVLCGIDRYIPVDVHLPGCPPRPEALLHGLMELQRKIDSQEILKAEWYQKGLKREFPIPELGPRGLVPKFNPEVWQPPDENPRKKHYGQPILVGKKDKAPNLETVPPQTTPPVPGAA